MAHTQLTCSAWCSTGAGDTLGKLLFLTDDINNCIDALLFFALCQSSIVARRCESCPKILAMQKLLSSLQKVIQQFEDFNLLSFLMPRCTLSNMDTGAPSLAPQTC